jgi:hypothetical protein
MDRTASELHNHVKFEQFWSKIHDKKLKQNSIVIFNGTRSCGILKKGSISKCRLLGLANSFFLLNLMIGFTWVSPSSFFFFYIDFSFAIIQNNYQMKKKKTKTR